MMGSQVVPEEMFWRSTMPPVVLGIKARAQISRHDGAKIIARAEDAIANPCDRIINRVAHGARNHLKNSCQNPPFSAQPTENVEEGVRAREKFAVGGEHHHAVGQA